MSESSLIYSNRRIIADMELDDPTHRLKGTRMKLKQMASFMNMDGTEKPIHTYIDENQTWHTYRDDEVVPLKGKR